MPSEHEGRLWRRKTSLMQWTKWSRDTRSSVQRPSTWSTTERGLFSSPSKILAFWGGDELNRIVLLGAVDFNVYQLNLLGSCNLSLACLTCRPHILAWVSPCHREIVSSLCFTIIASHDFLLFFICSLNTKITLTIRRDVLQPIVVALANFKCSR